MTPEEIHEIQRYLERCDPEKPLVHLDDPLYEPLDQGEPVRGSGGRSCIEQLAQRIRLRESAGPTCQLFTGFQGSGKTTELRRLKAHLEADKLVPTHVVFVDAEKLLDLYTPIAVTDVLRILAFALDREATTEQAIRAGKDPDEVEIGYLRRFFDFLARLDPQIKEIGFDTYGPKLMFEIKDNPNFRQRVQSAIELRFQAFAEEAKAMMTDAINRLRTATHAQRVVVIVDSLEKLRPIHDDARDSIEAAAESVFVAHAEWLRLPFHVIYTFPFWLRFRAPTLGALYNSEPRILPMVKITERGGGPHAEGLARLQSLVGRRVSLSRVFGTALDQTLQPILEASGGYPRDLLRMVREVISDASSLPVTPADTQRIIAQLAQTYRFVIRSPDVELLTEIAGTNTLPQGDGARLSTFSSLFSRHLILAYLNGDEWYDIHPLVRRAPQVSEALAARDKAEAKEQPTKAS